MSASVELKTPNVSTVNNDPYYKKLEQGIRHGLQLNEHDPYGTDALIRSTEGALSLGARLSQIATPAALKSFIEKI